jgi:hypothetical protein
MLAIARLTFATGGARYRINNIVLQLWGAMGQLLDTSMRRRTNRICRCAGPVDVGQSPHRSSLQWNAAPRSNAKRLVHARRSRAGCP